MLYPATGAASERASAGRRHVAVRISLPSLGSFVLSTELLAFFGRCPLMFVRGACGGKGTTWRNGVFQQWVLGIELRVSYHNGLAVPEVLK